MSNVRKRDVNSLANGISSKATTLWKKSFQVGATWEEKDDFLDVIYWMRQIFALLNGIAWGLIPLQGIFGIVLFLGINCGIVYIYVAKYQMVDEDDYGGIQELLKEGLFTAFAVFMVCWILVYTGTYKHGYR